MENQDQMTAERSLEIIQQSIRQSRKDVTRQIALPMLWWGALVMLTALVVGHLWAHNGGPVWNLLWFAMTVIGFIGQYFIIRKQGPMPSNVISKTVGSIWLSFCLLTLSVTISIYVAAMMGALKVDFPLSAVIILLMSLSCSIMGMVLQHGAMTGGGLAAGIIFSGFCVSFPGPYEMVAIALTALFTLIMPAAIILYVTREKQ